MMTKRKSKNANRLKYLLLIPVLMSMLIYTSCEKEQIEDTPETTTIELDKNPHAIELRKLIGNKDINIQYSGAKNTITLSTEDLLTLLKDNTIKQSTYKSPENIINFSTVQDPPIFPGCEGTDLRTCFSRSINNHIQRKFNSNLATGLGISPGKKRLFVMFRISETGHIIDIQVRAPHPKLQEEAMRVVKTLPKMTPAKQGGKNVSIRYSLPIAFMVE